MSMIYSDYNRDRIGWFFGVSGWQLALLAASALPVIISLQHGAWMAALLFSAVWLLVLVITVVPVRGGRPPAGSWHRPRSRLAGLLAGRAGAVKPRPVRSRSDRGGSARCAQRCGCSRRAAAGPELVRVAIIQNHAAKTWAVTAAITHPASGCATPTTGIDRPRV